MKNEKHSTGKSSPLTRKIMLNETMLEEAQQLDSLVTLEIICLNYNQRTKRNQEDNVRIKHKYQ